jgi:hypothetical protein
VAIDTRSGEAQTDNCREERQRTERDPGSEEPSPARRQRAAPADQ